MSFGSVVERIRIIINNVAIVCIHHIFFFACYTLPLILIFITNTLFARSVAIGKAIAYIPMI